MNIPNRKISFSRTLPLVALTLFLFSSLAIATIYIRSNLDNRQQAAKNVETESINSTESFDRSQIKVKVLSVVYDPILENHAGQRLHEYHEWYDPGVLASQLVDKLNQSSHGTVQYEIVETIVRDEWPLHENGQRYTDETYLPPPPDDPLGPTDYHALIADNNIVQKVNDGLVDEVWLWGAPNFSWSEAAMAGRGAYWINGNPITDIPTKRFAIMGFVYERNVGLAMHSYSHRTENILWRMYRTWESSTINDWSAFSLVDANAPDYEYAGCGNAHFPSNGTDDYDYDNKGQVSSFCDSFYNFPNYSVQSRQTINCTAWNPECGTENTDSQQAYFDWWFHHMPHVPGIKGGKLNNWWRYITNPHEYSDQALFVEPATEYTEQNAGNWTCQTVAGYATCSDSTEHVYRGQYSLKLETNSGDDTFAQYPSVGSAGINASNATYMKLTVYTESVPEEGFQNYSPTVYLKQSNGSYFKFTPKSDETLNSTIDNRYTFLIPLAGDGEWTRETQGAPSLSQIDKIEIHFDVYEAAFTVYLDDVSFVNTLLNDTTPPSATISQPAAGSNNSGIVKVVVEANDLHTAVHGAELYVDGNPISSDSLRPFIFYWNANTVPSGSHVLTTKAYDAFNNEVTSPGVTITTTAIIPPAPQNFSVNSTPSQATLSWSAVSGATAYHIERCTGASCSNFVEIATVTAAPYVNTGLDASAVYRYRVRANNGQLGPYSSVIASSVTWTINAVPVCANGNSPSQPAFVKHAHWPPDPLSWTYDMINLGAHTVTVVSRNSGSSGYVQMSNAANVLPPTGTPPSSGITYGTYFNPPTAMAKLSRSAPALPQGTYTIQYLAPSSWCAPTPPSPSPSPVPSGTCTVTGPTTVVYPQQATYTATFNFPAGNLNDAYVQVAETGSASSWNTVYTQENPGASSWTATVPISFPYSNKSYYVTCGALDTAGKICSANPWCEWSPNPPSSLTCGPKMYDCGASDVITVQSVPQPSPAPGVFLNEGQNKNCNTICQEHSLTCVDVGTNGTNNKALYNNAQGQCVEVSNITCSNYMDGGFNLNCTASANGETHKVDWTYCKCQ